MDINVLRGIATILVMVAFLGVCWWVYIYRSRDHFNEAAQLPFEEKDDLLQSANKESNHE